MINPSDQQSVIIIGGGIIAIACAHYLHEAGYTVTIVEQNTIANACSSGNCGYICPSHILPLATPEALKDAVASLFNPSAAFRVKFRLDAAFLKWMWQFAQRCNTKAMIDCGRHLKSILDSSAVEYSSLLDDGNIECDWKRTGLLYVLQSAKGMEKFAITEALIGDHYGLRARKFDGRDLPQLDPAFRSDLAGAFHYEDDASLRPEQLGASWRARLARNGVRFVEHCVFETLERTRGRINGIQTSQGSMRADHYILATGAMSAKLASQFGGHILVEPGKGYSVTMALPENAPKYPMLLPEHHVGISPFANGFRLGSMMEFTGFDASLPVARVKQLRRSVEPYLRTRLPADNLATWYGWRPMTPDSLPIIGRARGLDNAYLATGHNMLGMTLAPATGKLISEIVQGKIPHIDAQPFSPARFH